MRSVGSSTPMKEDDGKFHIPPSDTTRSVSNPESDKKMEQKIRKELQESNPNLDQLTKLDFDRYIENMKTVLQKKDFLIGRDHLAKTEKVKGIVAGFGSMFSEQPAVKPEYDPEKSPTIVEKAQFIIASNSNSISKALLLAHLMDRHLKKINKGELTSNSHPDTINFMKAACDIARFDSKKFPDKFYSPPNQQTHISLRRGSDSE